MPHFDLYLRGFSAHPFEGPAEGLQRVLGLSHDAATQLAANLPQYVKVGIDRREASDWRRQLEGFGAQVELHAHLAGRSPMQTLPTGATRPRSDRPSVRPSAAATISISPPSGPPTGPTSDAPKPWKSPRAPDIPATPPPPQDLAAMLSSERIMASAPPPPNAAAADPERPTSDPPISPSGRIMGSVRPPTMVNSPSSMPPPGSEHPPIAASAPPPDFDEVLGHPSGRPPSEPPRELWAPKPVYRTDPPPAAPFTLHVPIRYLAIAVVLGGLLWMLYSMASGLG